jgi:2-dehydropantoate 2-reductase
MKIAIYGAGAIGGWLAVKLARAGHEVGVVARGATLQALRRNGLSLVTRDETLHAQVSASDDGAALGPQDLVVLAVKAPALPAVAANIAPLLGPETAVLTAMNGVPWWFCDGLAGVAAGRPLQSVDPGGAINAAIPAARTLGGVVHASCLVESPGVVRLQQGNRLIVGEALAGVPAERADRIATLLRQAGFDAEVSPQIQRDVWFKLWGNMTMNPMSAITGATTDVLLADEQVRQFAARIMLEARDIGARLGIPIEDSPEERLQVTLQRGAMRTSMLQDVDAGKSVELDALLGAVRELGALTGVATPFTDALFGLTRVFASRLGLYSA